MENEPVSGTPVFGNHQLDALEGSIPSQQQVKPVPIPSLSHFGTSGARPRGAKLLAQAPELGEWWVAK